MSKRYFIHLISANRVGIVAAMSSALAELGADLQEVSQTVMREFFTIILAADFPETRRPEEILATIKRSCAEFGAEVSIKDPEVDLPQPAPPEGIERYFLTITGNDTPGIIRRISARLAGLDIDISDLYAVRDEREGGFIAIFELSIPVGLDAVSLQEELKHLGTTENLSVALQHENIFHATHDARPVKIRLPVGKKVGTP